VHTAIISDLHLGSGADEDLLRDAEIRRTLLAEIAAADRLVLLGDVLELRELPLPAVLDAARPFFEELGETMAGRPVLLVPGNHDHRLAEPLLEGGALEGRRLGLEQRSDPAGEATTLIAAWLGDAELEIAYPGAWLRDDVYATHGHYMDCHMSLPRLECVVAAASMRVFGSLPARTRPAEYERVLQPVYGLTFSLAQARLAGRASRPSERVWQTISGRNGRRVRRAALRAGIPTSVWVLNRLLRAGFDPDLSGAAISQSGIDAATEMSGRPHPSSRPRPRRGRVAVARRRPPPQHRQLGLRRRLPPPRISAGALLAGDGDVARGRGAAPPGAAVDRTHPRRTEEATEPL
jgi:hypothetical protein